MASNPFCWIFLMTINCYLYFCIEIHIKSSSSSKIESREYIYKFHWNSWIVLLYLTYCKTNIFVYSFYTRKNAAATHGRTIMIYKGRFWRILNNSNSTIILFLIINTELFPRSFCEMFYNKNRSFPILWR